MVSENQSIELSETVLSPKGIALVQESRVLAMNQPKGHLMFIFIQMVMFSVFKNVF